jgi:hypothetical protein
MGDSLPHAPTAARPGRDAASARRACRPEAWILIAVCRKVLLEVFTIVESDSISRSTKESSTLAALRYTLKG